MKVEEVRLPAGWLQRDIARANKRLAEWNPFYLAKETTVGFGNLPEGTYSREIPLEFDYAGGTLQCVMQVTPELEDVLRREIEAEGGGIVGRMQVVTRLWGEEG